MQEKGVKQMSLIALPVVDKQFWILKENDRKVGNIEACAGGYQVKINNQISQFKTIKLVARHINIEFEPMVKISKSNLIANHVYGYPVSGQIYNPMWDVSQRLPVYTKTTKSKSWFVAGWYNVRQGRVWKTVLAPKLIVLQRYPYQGPYYSESEAHDHSSTKVC
jgi:hypothetical protein